jgi:hypothetical protein
MEVVPILPGEEVIGCSKEWCAPSWQVLACNWAATVFHLNYWDGLRCDIMHLSMSHHIRCSLLFLR